MMPISPCRAGCSTSAAPWAMAAVPMPASFVKVPLETPRRSVVIMLPTRPPVTASGSNAPRRIARNASPTSSHRSATAPQHSRMYAAPTTGTRISAASAMALAPPVTIRTTAAASSSPARIRRPFEVPLTSSADITALTWAALPTPKAAMMPKQLYRYARKCHRFCKPFRMMYMGPARPSGSRNRTARTLSAYLTPIPRKALTHIQNTAPGPPRAMAPATPAMFPVPTVAASAVHNARKPESRLRSRRKNSRTAAGSSRSWTHPVSPVSQIPVPRISPSTGTPHKNSLNRSRIRPPTEKAAAFATAFVIISRFPKYRAGSRRWPPCRCGPREPSSAPAGRRPCPPWPACPPCTSSA